MARMGRKEAIAELIAMRKQINRIINELSGDAEHRQFATAIEAGEPRPGRQLRAYDLEPASAEEVAEAWGIRLDAEDGTIPEWFRTKYGEHLASPQIDM